MKKKSKLPEELKVRYQPPGALRPYARNARTHPEKQLAKLGASIKAFGFNTPVLVDETNCIIGGHARVEAAKRLGLELVPTICLGHLSEAKRRAFILADNKIAEQAGWDLELLRAEFSELNELPDLDFSIEASGFDTAEIDDLLELSPGGQLDPIADAIPALADSPVSRVGDLWCLGEHKLFVGDAREKASFSRVLGREVATMAFTDPPYNVRIDGHAGGMGKAERREFVMASGEMSPAEFRNFLTDVLVLLANFSSDGAIHFVCMDWRHLDELSAAGRAAYDELKNVIVWAKTNAGMGSFYRSAHELIFVFKKGKGSHINNFGLGEGGRYRTNVWTYAGVNTFGRRRDEELLMHPTVKPVALVADAIRDVSRRGEIVLDPFGGSGTTIIAAQKTGRRARLVELDPLYADVICRRWRKFSGKDAVLESGETFCEREAFAAPDAEAAE